MSAPGGVERFFDLGQVATLLGGYLDVIGGMLEFVMLFCITGAGHFSANAERKRTQKSFNDGRDICDWGNN